MTYANAIPGLVERLQTVPGLTVHVGPPTSAHQFPLAFFYLARSTALSGVQVRGAKYVVLVQVVVRWQDNTVAEQEIAALHDALVPLFDAQTRDANGHAYTTLGGRVNQTKIIDIRADGTDGFPTIGDTPLRGCVFELELLDKPL